VIKKERTVYRIVYAVEARVVDGVFFFQA